MDKIQAPGAFVDAVRAFHLLPAVLVEPFALVVPWLELLVGLYVVSGFLSRVAAAGSIALLSMFVAALGTALATGDTAHACGCFGQGAQANPILALLDGGDTITWWDLIRDLALIALSTMIVVYGPGRVSIDGIVRGRRLELES